jgi:hypothetical protein
MQQHRLHAVLAWLTSGIHDIVRLPAPSPASPIWVVGSETAQIDGLVLIGFCLLRTSSVEFAAVTASKQFMLYQKAQRNPDHRCYRHAGQREERLSETRRLLRLVPVQAAAVRRKQQRRRIKSIR